MASTDYRSRTYYLVGNTASGFREEFHWTYFLDWQADISPRLFYCEGRVFGQYEWQARNPAATLLQQINDLKKQPPVKGPYRRGGELQGWIEYRDEPDWEKFIEVMIEMAFEEVRSEHEVDDALRSFRTDLATALSGVAHKSLAAN